MSGMGTVHRIRRRLSVTAPRRLVGRVLGPRVLLVSVPKAGTNLVRRVLEMLPGMSHADTIALLPVEQQLARIERLRRGCIIATHLKWQPGLQEILAAEDIRGVFVSRDPRDVCVSWFRYVMREERHRWHPFLKRLQSDHERLMSVISGIDEHPPGDRRWKLPSIDAVYRDRLAYAAHPRFCTVTFEDLVGARGGGDDERQKNTISRIAEHVRLRLSARRLEQIAADAFSADSPTFRLGQIGAWRNEMSARHKDRFKEVAGQLLVDLGYETDPDW